MSADPVRRLFACYSRQDGRRVHELVRLIRVSGAPVFLDVDSIRAGTKWQTEIDLAIDASDAVVVFWSLTAAQSPEVAREVEVATRLGKDIVPVLLDDIPLSAELAEFQGVLLADLWYPHDATFDTSPYVAELIDRILHSKRN
jgi:hypothetical protein